MKQILTRVAMQMIALICSAILGCASVATIDRPACSLPPLPALPEIQSSDLETLPAPVYWALMDRERRLVDWALELESIALSICAHEQVARK